MARGRQPAKKNGPTTRIRALEQRLAATGDILRAISHGQSVQPVFDAIVASAVRLLHTRTCVLGRVDGNHIELAAFTSTDDAGDAAVRAAHPQPLDSDSASARAIRERAPFNVADARTDPRTSAAMHGIARVRGFRSLLAVPLLRRNDVLGAITVSRSEAGGFTDDEIALLQTLADQAVIAIENARLLAELQASNRETTEALEQQTATAEILQVIGRSPTDSRPVFEAIARSGHRVCGALGCTVLIVDQGMLHVAATYGVHPERVERFRSQFPMPLSLDVDITRTVLTCTVVHLADIEHNPLAKEEYRESARLGRYQTRLMIPMVRGGVGLGAIVVTRADPAPFPDRQVELMKTFADQAVIAIENVRLFTELQASNRELTTALDTQTATSDILRVISRTQTEVQPVFDAIVASAVRLLGAHTGALTRIAGDRIEIAALTSADDAGDAALRSRFPQSLHSEDPHAQAMRARVPLNVADAQTDPRWPDSARTYAQARGYRSAVVVPMLRDDEVVGSIGVNRREPGGFTDDEIALLQTFADQALIAIENARLLTALQDKNESLTEALEQQTATSEILNVIASSPTDLQPVFDTIAASATRLCDALYGLVFRFDGEMITLAADHGASSEALAAIRRAYPAPPGPTSLAAQAILKRRIIAIADTERSTEYPHIAERAAAIGYRSGISVPMLRGEMAIGAINVIRAQPMPFTATQIDLLKTFADQAVIAIENVRLFTELQASNRELTTALDMQTATSDILRAISRAQTDLQPVFDAIVASAVRLLGAYSGTLTRVAGDQLTLAALTTTDAAGDAALRTRFPQPLSSMGPHAYAVRDRAPVNIADAHTDPRLSDAVHAYARIRNYRSQVSVPMLRHDEAVGTISVTRREPGGFAADEIALLQTFADQAVIAIENARLIGELQARTHELTRSVGELRALGEIGQAIGSTLDLQTVLSTIVARATPLAGADAGVIYEYDEARAVFEPRATARLEDEIVRALVAAPVRKGQGATGRLAEVMAPNQVADVQGLGDQLPVREILVRAGYRALLAVPLGREGRLLGGLTVFRKTPGEYDANVVELLQTFATQSALAIQNARLFREIEIKSRELEIASQHKSEFLASMSHELRTPLNAIIGFSDVLLEGMFGETNEKQTEYLRDILSSGQHLLSLINDILDLSKIEAGRMELDVAAFDLPTAIDDAILLMRERAGRRGITLERHVDEGLGEIRADQRKVKQVLLNLLSNAVKFTPEGGRIAARAGRANGAAEISVTDTGIGIAPEDQDTVFEEFRQVGQADKKAEGTGLGLALCRKFVELHGGRIWVKSQVGVGSTFTFTIP